MPIPGLQDFLGSEDKELKGEDAERSSGTKADIIRPLIGIVLSGKRVLQNLISYSAK